MEHRFVHPECSTIIIGSQSLFSACMGTSLLVSPTRNLATLLNPSVPQVTIASWHTTDRKMHACLAISLSWTFQRFKKAKCSHWNQGCCSTSLRIIMHHLRNCGQMKLCTKGNGVTLSPSAATSGPFLLYWWVLCFKSSIPPIFTLASFHVKQSFGLLL